MLISRRCSGFRSQDIVNDIFDSSSAVILLQQVEDLIEGGRRTRAAPKLVEDRACSESPGAAQIPI